jgi:hypothetical protein
VSTHRLLPESEIDRLLSLSEDDDLEPLSDTRTIVATISLAYQTDLENCNIPGAYIPESQVIAEQYRKAAGDQHLLTSSNHDVTTIARLTAAFPRFCSISLDSSDKSWGKEDWEAFVGFEKRAFTTLGDTDSGQSNMSFTLNRVLQAIAQAESLCKAAGRRLNLRSLEATWSEVDDDWSPHSHQNIRLQSLDIHPSCRADLRSVLSRLTSLHVDINGFSKPENFENDAGKIQEALKILLSSSKLRDLQIDFVDDGEIMDDDMISMTRPDETWIGDSILAMVVAVERSYCLRALTLNCDEMIVSQATVEKLIQKHTATLETIDVQAEMPDPATAPVSISDLRERFKILLRIIAGCHSIARLVLNMDNEDCVVLYVNEWRSEHIMERIQSMIMRPTGPEHDFFWANWDEYSESGDGDDDDEDRQVAEPEREIHNGTFSRQQVS